jgi:hypothetical protein
MPARVGRSVILSGHAGRVLALHRGELRLIDLESAEERVILPSGIACLWASPDGTAFLAQGKDATQPSRHSMDPRCTSRGRTVAMVHRCRATGWSSNGSKAKAARAPCC